MSVYKQSVSSSQTELDFLNAVYDYFLQINGVVMNPSKAELETDFNAVDGTSNRFVFTATLRGITIRFTRNATGLNYAKEYKIILDNTTISEGTVSFTSSLSSPSSHVLREWNLCMVLFNDGMKFTTSSTNFIVFFSNINNVSAVLYQTVTSNPVDGLGKKYLKKMGDDSTTYKIAPMLVYSAGDENIDYFAFSILCDSSLQKVATLNNIKHCSNVSIDRIFTIDGNDYYSIATDCIVEI